MPALEWQERPPETEEKTVTLSERDVEDAARLLRLLAGDPKETGSRSTQWLLSRARKIIRNREFRTAYFNPAMFGEGPWDILLALYVTNSAGARQTRASLAKRLAMPSSTVHRWIDYLEKERFVQRYAHPTDKRTNFVSLLEKGRKTMDDYLSAIAE